MFRLHTIAFAMLAAVAASPALALPAYRAAGTAGTASFQAQSDATAGNLTIGLIDATGQRAPVFDNTSPPSNPNGIGPVGPGATAAFTFSSASVLVDVTNMDPDGFELGFGNSSTLYTDLTPTFNFFVQDGDLLYTSDTATAGTHFRFTPQNNGLLLGYSSAGGGAFNDATVLFTGITPATAAGVPEPASLLLIPLALGALALKKRASL